tara:strand:+ start:6 stop:2195 length:2190 start_codon:yes stop_codon:yes gene_type:complete
MRRLVSNFFIILFLTTSLFIIILSTIGFETNKFNKFIIQRINQADNNLSIKLSAIKFKLDIQELSLFLETNNLNIKYYDLDIPTKNVKVYMDFVSLFKADPKIKKINLVANQIDAKKLKEISVFIKPSNLKSFINNKIKSGTLDMKLEVFLDENNLLNEYIVRGSVIDFESEIFKNIKLEKTKFDFIADSTDVLVKNFNGVSGPIKIFNGDLKLKLLKEIDLETNFQTKIIYNNDLSNYHNFRSELNYLNNIKNIEADLNNNFKIKLDKTYKIKKYDYKIKGKIDKISYNFKEKYYNNIISEDVSQLSFINAEIKSHLSSKSKKLDISGKYSLNKSKYLPFNTKNSFSDKSLNLEVDFDFNKLLNLEIINYEKPDGILSKIRINLDKQENNITLNNLTYTQGKNSILFNGLKIKNNKFISFDKISVNTEKNGQTNNDFLITNNKKILIKGDKFDASNLPKILKNKTDNNTFNNFNKDIEIDLINIFAPLSENLQNFKLIGKIEKGNFVKISSKGDFGKNNFLDISMMSNKDRKKKYLEIYSDLPKPLLTEYNFFKGLVGGKLLYSSILESDLSESKLKIENFKVVNAPGMVKLLSLADLGGLADLAEGEGLSFDILEIKMKKINNTLQLSEILALGPSISVLMEGYQDQSVTSLKGTLVPAKTLNKMISKIPVLGNIVIPKEVGEGLFGISFKMKGPPGNIKTTINPIRTLTPRFIQKIVDKKKNNNTK